MTCGCSWHITPSRSGTSCRLIKYLQGKLAPVQVPWAPHGNPAVRYFINQLVLEEESDTIEGSGGPSYSSHFEFYCHGDARDRRRRRESAPLCRLGAGAGTRCRALFGPGAAAVALLQRDHLLLHSRGQAACCRRGARGWPRAGDPGDVSLAAHTHGDQRAGRARLSLLSQPPHPSGRGLSWTLSLSMLEQLCGDDPERLEEAVVAAEEAICARIRFWDGVLRRCATIARLTASGAGCPRRVGILR